MGRAIEPAIAPLGFDWKIGVGLIGAFAAREVFVSTMGVIYGVGEDADENSMALRDRMRAETRQDGTPVYSPNPAAFAASIKLWAAIMQNFQPRQRRPDCRYQASVLLCTPLVPQHRGLPFLQADDATWPCDWLCLPVTH